MATLVCQGEVQADIIPRQKLGINHHRWGTRPHARRVEIAVDETGCQVLVQRLLLEGGQASRLRVQQACVDDSNTIKEIFTLLDQSCVPSVWSNLRFT